MDANSLFSYQRIWIALRNTRTVGHSYGDLLQFLFIVKQVEITRIYKNCFCDTKWLAMVENKKVDVKISHFKLNTIFWTIFIKADYCA